MLAVKGFYYIMFLGETNMYCIGIDIGGTTIKIGVVDEKPEIIFRRDVKTTTPFKIEELAKTTLDLLSSNGIKKEEVKGVVVGCPGLIDTEGGEIHICSVLELRDYPFVKNFEKLTGFPTQIYNDANLATIAEVKFGQGKGCKHAVMLTLGTGVGGGIVADGKLYIGNKGMGAEIGHFMSEPYGEQCSCGRRGCFEKYASASALVRQMRQAMQNDENCSVWQQVSSIDDVDGKIIFQEYNKGDKTTIAVVEKYIEYLSEGILTLMNVFRPQVVLLGGGISNWGNFLANKITQYCEKFEYGYKNSPKVAIKIATLKNDAGILGSRAILFN